MSWRMVKRTWCLVALIAAGFVLLFVFRGSLSGNHSSVYFFVSMCVNAVRKNEYAALCKRKFGLMCSKIFSIPV